VWDIALAYAVREPGQHGKYVVLQDTTSLGLLRDDAAGIAMRFRTSKVEVPDRLLERFVEVNRTPVQLTDAFRANRRVGTISATRAHDLFRGSDPDASWAQFYKTYADAAGLFEISRPSFSDDLALIHVFSSCGSECASGRFFLLRATHGTWVLQAVVTTGVS